MYKLLSIIAILFSLNSFAYTIVDEAGNYSAPILAGQTILVGNVVISNTSTELIIKATSDTALNWYIQKVHVYASATAAIPGTPIPGQFPYHSITYSPPISNYELRIPLSELGIDCSGQLYMAIHLEMIKLNSSGSVVQTETGWSYGQDPFNSNRWGWQFTYQGKCEQNVINGCTYTQGYWKNHSKYSKPKTEPWVKESSSQIGATEDKMICGMSWYKVLTTTPKTGNAWYILAHQWISAKLNSFTGATIPSQVDLNLAEALLVTNCSTVKSSTSTGQTMTILGGILASYNEGELEVPHCN